MKLTKLIDEAIAMHQHLCKTGQSTDKEVIIAWPDSTLPGNFLLFRKVLDIGEDDSLDYAENDALDAVILYPAKWEGESW